MGSPTSTTSDRTVAVETLDGAVVRFAGDSGDGMQLAGTQLTNTSAAFGNDVATLPDFPAEIRAPAGSLAGVSGFQINFSERKIRTPGDGCDVLVAMNPAALKANLTDIVIGGVVIANSDAFNKTNLAKAGLDENPLEDGTLDRYRVFKVPIDHLTTEAAKDTGLGSKALLRTKNFFALGLVYWLYGRSMEPTLLWIDSKFKSVPAVATANAKALRAGYYYGETTEEFVVRYEIRKADIPPGRYRKITGNEAIAIGLIAAAKRAEKPLFYGSYPITPASDILHELSSRIEYGVKTFQAEDEIAAMTAVIGAAYAGAIAATGTSGPGLALKSEAIGLAVMIELPMVVISVQRGGPSTGLPTKIEQADLWQAVFGRHGECPVVVIAPKSPSDCFDITIEAVRLAIRHMTPVIVLSDGYLANGAEPWRTPDMESLPDLRVEHPSDNGEEFQPYVRDEHLARPWAIPGTKGLQHRVGGLEKADITGNVCYDPANHEKMIGLRAAKIAGVADDIPDLAVEGSADADLLVLGWGSTYGAIISAAEQIHDGGQRVATAHLRYLSPFPKNLGEVLRSYKKILIPELNRGQLLQMIQAKYLVETIGYNKVQGLPFKIAEIEQKILEVLKG